MTKHNKVMNTYSNQTGSQTFMQNNQTSTQKHQKNNQRSLTHLSKEVLTWKMPGGKWFKPYTPAGGNRMKRKAIKQWYDITSDQRQVAIYVTLAYVVKK